MSYICSACSFKSKEERVAFQHEADAFDEQILKGVPHAKAVVHLTGPVQE